MGARGRFLAFLDFRSRVILAVIGAGLAFWGYDEFRVASWAKSLGLLGGGTAAVLLALVSAVLARPVKPGSGRAAAEPDVPPALPGRLEAIAVVFMLMFFLAAGATATWLAMALFSGQWLLVLLALLPALPFNVPFFLHVRGVVRADPREVFFGLRRCLWLVVAVVAYLAAVGGVLFVTFSR